MSWLLFVLFLLLNCSFKVKNVKVKKFLHSTASLCKTVWLLVLKAHLFNSSEYSLTNPPHQIFSLEVELLAKMLESQRRRGLFGRKGVGEDHFSHFCGTFAFGRPREAVGLAQMTRRHFDAGGSSVASPD